MRGPGWRLTMEPVAAMVAWSLIKVDDENPKGLVWAGLIEDASHARGLVGGLGNALGVLADPLGEATLARELGTTLLPQVLRDALEGAGPLPTLTLLVRGWLASVPWDALALNWGGTRLVERCLLLGGLPPGLTADVALIDPAPDASTCLWVVDPGPPDGGWPPLFPAGYPERIQQLKNEHDELVPDGMPFGLDDLSAELMAQRWGQLAYLGHVSSDPQSPAAAALVLSAPDCEALFTAHHWLRDPGRWPAPAKVALLGCGSDDSAAFEHAGLPTAAMQAGASLVTTTRWTLPNTAGAIELLRAVATAQRIAGLHGVRRWQLDQLGHWRRTGAAHAAPLYWASLVTYDRNLLLEQADG